MAEKRKKRKRKTMPQLAKSILNRAYERGMRERTQLLSTMVAQVQETAERTRDALEQLDAMLEAQALEEEDRTGRR